MLAVIFLLANLNVFVERKKCQNWETLKCTRKTEARTFLSMVINKINKNKKGLPLLAASLTHRLPVHTICSLTSKFKVKEVFPVKEKIVLSVYIVQPSDWTWL